MCIRDSWQVGGDDPVPQVFGDFARRHQHVENAGIVDENVEPAVCRYGCIDHEGDVLFAGDIGGDGQCLSPCVADGFCGFSGRNSVDVRHDDGSPLFGEQEGDFPPHA